MNFLKQSLETPYVMMLEYVLQIKLSGERTPKTFITSVFSVVLSGAQIPSTEYESEYEYKKSFITLGPDLGRITFVMRRRSTA